ncbi:hypothetical protein D7Y28_21100 [Stenotrophomonas maltophilia]|nr:hypothetical protein [Stenotrophomonas maltophilia]
MVRCGGWGWSGFQSQIPLNFGPHQQGLGTGIGRDHRHACSLNAGQEVGAVTGQLGMDLLQLSQKVQAWRFLFTRFTFVHGFRPLDF